MILFLAACNDAGTPLYGDTNDEYWTSDVTISEDTTLAAGTDVYVSPGVTVTVSADVTITVEGGFFAEGTADDPVTFTGDPAAPWKGLVFAPSVTPATFSGVDEYSEGSILENVVVAHAMRGVELTGSSPYLHAVTFTANEIPATVDTVGGGGLLIADGATPRVRDCRFEDNVANTFAFGGGLYVDGANPILQDNTFTGNVASYGGGIATDNMASPLVGNRFESNDSQSEGGGVSLVSTVSALLNNTITGNHAKTDGAGVHICVDCDPHAAPTLMDNTVSGNLSDTSNANDGAAGIGAAFLGLLTHNDIHDNLRDGQPSDFTWFNLTSEAWPAWVANPDLSDNWWGTTDADAIAATVWDGLDNPAYTTVAVDPVRHGPFGDPLPRVVIASRRNRYTDAGDTLAVYLTVYNPGEAATFTVTVSRDDGAPVPDPGIPGEVASGSGWSAAMPANAVWFGTLVEESWDGTAGSDVTWTATLSDAGGVVGVPSVARYELAPG